MNLVERINSDKSLKLLLVLILLVTIVLFMKIFYEYYVYSKNLELESAKVVLNDDNVVDVIEYSDVLKLDNGKLDSTNKIVSLSAEYNDSANYNVYVKVNNSVSNLALKVIDNKGTSNIIDLSNKVGLYLVKSDCAINNSKDENISVQSLSMGELTNQVGLIKGVVEIPEASETKTQPLSESIAPNGTSKKISFYVNETGAEEYTVSLTATTGSSSSAETYSGTLQLSNTETNGIPRNHILPLNLNIGDSDFIIEVYVAPIGGYPRNIPTTSDPTDPNATSTVDVPEGCSLRVKDASTNRYYNLSVSSSTPAGIVEIGDDPQWAHITALQAEGNISIIAVFNCIIIYSKLLTFKSFIVM